ncbi:MAG: hypothetical protein ACYC65_00010 [Candidatus Limnocylindrales bacterium]
MQPLKHGTADALEPDNVDVTVARACARLFATDAHHSTSASSKAFMGAVARAHSRFSSRSASSAASSFACSTSSTRRRSVAATRLIESLAYGPPSVAAR